MTTYWAIFTKNIWSRFQFGVSMSRLDTENNVTVAEYVKLKGV